MMWPRIDVQMAEVGQSAVISQVQITVQTQLFHKFYWFTTNEA